MIRPKSPDEIEVLAEGGRRLATILAELAELVRPGITSFALEDKARELCEKLGGTPAFLNYQPAGADTPFPAALCLSVNEEIVHGIPNRIDRSLEEGDIATLDMGFMYQNLITDSAITVGVGEISNEKKLLLECTRQALDAGIDAAGAGEPVGNIGQAIEESIDRCKSSSNKSYAIFENLVGHGVGYQVHEEPNIFNYTVEGKTLLLPQGAVLAIEPMIGLGTEENIILDDGYTIVTADGSLAAHFEHTIAVLESGPQILTTL